LSQILADQPSVQDISPRRRRLWPLVAKVSIVLLVLVGIHRTLASAWSELAQQRLDLSGGWLIAAGGLYVLGLVPAAWYWYWLLRSFGQRVDAPTAMRAHFIGHLGKYLPGKAMVFVLRIGLLPAEQRALGAASLAVYYETITFMGVGGCLAALVLTAWYRVGGLAGMVAVAAAAGGIVVTMPPLLRSLGRVVQWLKPGWSIANDLTRIRLRHAAVGWPTNLIVWILLGLSFWATLRAMLSVNEVSLSDLAFLTAAIALAVVLGSASMIPGGALVREAVLLELLDPRYGPGTALAAAVLLRMVWLLSEVVISVILYAVAWKPSQQRSRAD
jgi:hypothetical protein